MSLHKERIQKPIYSIDVTVTPPVNWFDVTLDKGERYEPGGGFRARWWGTGLAAGTVNCMPLEGKKVYPQDVAQGAYLGPEGSYPGGYLRWIESTLDASVFTIILDGFV